MRDDEVIGTPGGAAASEAAAGGAASVLTPNRLWTRVVLYSVLITALFELAQLAIPYLAFNINDLAVNGVGTVLGIFLLAIFRKRIEEAGLKTLALEISEFEKPDGGLSCLSIRFNPSARLPSC